MPVVPQRVAIYARVSSAKQRDAHTIDGQLQVLGAYIRQQQWQLVETYLDDGRSAKTGKLEAREGFARCVRDAEAGRFDLLAIVDVDRLTRTDDIGERAEILGPFQRAGVRIVSPSTGEIDLRTMFGQLDATLRSLYAAEENRKRAERIKAGKARAIAEGRKPAGPTPYGLRYDRATAAWSIDRDRAAVYREIIERVANGESCLLIADDLHDRDAPSPRGPWTRHKVWVLARSRHGMGEWTADKRQRLVIHVPAIVDAALWQRAQAALIAHGKRGLRRTEHVYLLEGLAVCAECGSPIAIRSATRNPNRANGNPSPAAYVCRARKLGRRGQVRCTATITGTAELDALVWEAVRERVLAAGFAGELAELCAARDADARDWAADLRGYRAHLARLDRVAAGQAARWRRGLLSDATYDLELAAAARERTTVEEQIRAAERGAGTAHEERPSDVRAVAASLQDLVGRAAKPNERQRIVRALIAPGVVVDGLDVTLTLLVSPGTERAGGSLSRAGVGCRTHHETIGGGALKIRLVT